MDEDEIVKQLEADLEFLKKYRFEGNAMYSTPRSQIQSALLLYRSNNRLSESSGKLATRNLWLSVAVLAVALVQVWIAVRPPSTVITMPSDPAPPSAPR
jgi:hypothetical protein